MVDDIAVRNITGQPGTGTVEVPNAGNRNVELRPRLTPSPMRSSGTLSFATSRSGALRVGLHDLAGRRVRRLRDQELTPAGKHQIQILPIDNQGRRLAPGVYFYRVEAAGETHTGRFVILQ